MTVPAYVCYAALPHLPADFFNLGAAATPTSVPSSESSESEAQPPASAAAGLGYRMPPVPPMFRPPVGMIPLPMGPGGPRRPPPPPPRMGGPPPGRPFPPGMCDAFVSSITSSMLGVGMHITLQGFVCLLE